MKLFRIYVDGKLFYHPHLSRLAITQAQVKEDAENIDSLTLSAPFNHPYLSSIKPMASEIVCMSGSAIVFEGRTIDDGSDFYNTHTWVCESALAYLNDSMQPPYEYTGSLSGLLELFLTEHNRTVEAKKQFMLGTVTVTDSNDYVSYSASDYSVTMTAIKEKLLDTYGGYLRVRYTENGNYLDYLADFDDTSIQTVEFGKNLLDVKIARDHSERITALIPFGAKLMETDEDGNEVETGKRVTIESVNDNVNYVYDETAVNEIGWIWTTEVWEDVTVPENLLRKAQVRIAELSQGITSMELSIVDESDTGADIDDIRARQYVQCKSVPHGIDGRYLCIGKTKDYLDPSGNTITIGASGVSLTGTSAKQSAALEAIPAELEQVHEKIESTGDTLREEISRQATDITKTCEEIILSAVETYVSKGEYDEFVESVETTLSILPGTIEAKFTELSEVIESVNGDLQKKYEERVKWIRFENGDIVLGEDGSPIVLRQENDRIAFRQGSGVSAPIIGYFSVDGLFTKKGTFEEAVQIGTFAWVMDADGGFSLMKLAAAANTAAVVGKAIVGTSTIDGRVITASRLNEIERNNSTAASAISTVKSTIGI